MNRHSKIQTVVMGISTEKKKENHANAYGFSLRKKILKIKAKLRNL